MFGIYLKSPWHDLIYDPNLLFTLFTCLCVHRSVCTPVQLAGRKGKFSKCYWIKKQIELVCIRLSVRLSTEFMDLYLIYLGYFSLKCLFVCLSVCLSVCILGWFEQIVSVRFFICSIIKSLTDMWKCSLFNIWFSRKKVSRCFYRCLNFINALYNK